MLSKKTIVCPDNLLKIAKTKGPVKVVIVNAGKQIAIESAKQGVKEGLIDPIFVGNKSTIEKLAKDIGGPIDVINWNKRHNLLTEATLVVNTTTLGMKGNPPLELNLSALPKKALINDIVYVPLETTFLRNARARGNPTVDGIGMLLHQARPGFAEWFNKDPLVTEDLRHYVLGINGG
mgnify:CR=1 FL=1